MVIFVIIMVLMVVIELILVMKFNGNFFCFVKIKFIVKRVEYNCISL